MIDALSQPAAWHRERSHLNHDWLTVSFLTFVQAWRDELDRVGGGDPLPVTAVPYLEDWGQYRPRLEALIAHAADALGPAHALANDPTLSDAARQLVVQAAHAAWQQSSGVTELVERLQSRVAQTDALVLCLLSGGQVPNAGTLLYDNGVAISRGLSALRSATEATR
jgi:hypothetical protein